MGRWGLVQPTGLALTARQAGIRVPAADTRSVVRVGAENKRCDLGAREW